MDDTPPTIPPESADLLRLLADPTRREIFLLIVQGEICNCEIAETLDIAQNLVSHHLGKLRHAGLIDMHRDPLDARWTHCTVNLETLTRAWEGLETVLHPSHVGTRIPACRVHAKRGTATRAAELSGKGTLR
ncbi:MAG: ArsR/SmtB family transcription factor [Solirubrobacteraceae bacterium]